ncbi:MAG: hypothetical protein ACFFAO_21290, partial [Candidatus Hermodarchaeota archaeon]
MVWGRQRTILLFFKSFIQQLNIIIVRRSEVSKVFFRTIIFSERTKRLVIYPSYSEDRFQFGCNLGI